MKNKLLNIILISLFSLTANSKNILLYWNEVPNTEKYELTYIINNNLTVTRFVTTTNAVISNVNNNQKYIIFIKSISNNTSSDYSKPLHINLNRVNNTNILSAPVVKYKIQ